jgi:16S rRNA (adenine1518-N6/adenine1519-N6)-dimethyltransferase
MAPGNMMDPSSNDMLDIVDKNDTVIGSGARSMIHARGLIHRAVHIFVFDNSSRIYVQRRSSIKDRFPGRLDSSAAGHVDSGEDYESAARRELMEELALDADIEHVLKVPASQITDNEHVALFKATTDSRPRPDPEEITWGGFMRGEELTGAMERAPGDFVPAFIYLWKRYLELFG